MPSNPPESAAAEPEAPAHHARGGTKHCPTCNGPLVEHGDDNPLKAGAYHCDHCGICWAHDLKAPR